MSDPGAAPLDVDSFFSPAKQDGGSVTADQLFSQPPSPPMSGTAMDQVFSDPSPKWGVSHVLKDFGQGFADNWGAYSSQATAERSEIMKPFYSDVNTAHSNIAKAFNEAIIRPAAFGLVTAFEAAKQTVLGVPSGVFAGAETAVANLGKNIGEALPGKTPVIMGQPMGFEAIGKELASDIEATGQGALLPLGLPIRLPEAKVVGAAEITQARELGVIGPEDPAGPGSSTAAIRGQVAEQRAEPEGLPTVPKAPQEVAGASPSPSAPEATVERQAPQEQPSAPVQAASPVRSEVEDVARQLDPVTFQQHDALTTRQDSYRQWLDELGQQRATSPEAVEAQERIDSILGKVAGVEERLTGAGAERLETARSDLKAVTTQDTPGMAFVRQKLLDAQHKLFDLGPKVAAARAEAQAAAHEEIARTTAPDQAAAAAEAIRAQIDAVTHSLSPEIHDGLPHKSERPAAEAGGIQGEDEVLPGGGNAPGPATSADEGAPAPGAEPAGGNQPAAEGAAGPGGTAGERAPAEVSVSQKTPSPLKANMRPVEGTGEAHPRRLSEGVEASAIEHDLTKGFDDLPEYNRVSMEDQAAKAADLIEKDYEAAKDIAMGNKAPPKGVLPESVFVAVEKRALAEGDVETLRRLATQSRLVSEATTMGQRIRTLGERDPTSPIDAIQEVQQAREAALEARGTKDVEAAKKAVVDEAKDAIKQAAPKVPAWEKFLDSIQC